MLNYQKLGLIPTFVILDSKEYEGDSLPPYTISIRRIYLPEPAILIIGLVPFEHIDNYISTLPGRKRDIIKGYEYQRWIYDDNLIQVERISKGIILKPIENFEDRMYHFFGPVFQPQKQRPPHWVELVIMFGKQIDPFIPLTKAYRLALKYDSSLPRISKQSLSYHNQIIKRKYWLGNRATIFRPMNLTPVSAFIVKGKYAPVFARILVRMPGFFSAMIEQDKAVIIGQPDCGYIETIYRNAYSFNLEIRQVLLSSNDMRSWIPRLWKFAKNKRWIFNEKEESIRNTASIRCLQHFNSNSR